MSCCRLSILSLLVSLLTLAGVGSAQGIVLDWDSVTWTPGLTNSFDIDPAVAGNDVTVAIGGDTATLQNGTPGLTTHFGGGLATAQNTLALGVDFANQSQFITVTISFSNLYLQGVENVSFTIFDIDFDNQKNSSEYQDQLRSITGLSIDGVTQIAPTITTSTANTRSGTGLTQVVTGTSPAVDSGVGSGNGNVTISFSTNAIQSFTFRYGSGTGTDTNPTYQHIGIHDLSFTPVPEINPALTAALSCFAATGLMIFHRARVKSRR